MACYDPLPAWQSTPGAKPELWPKRNIPNLTLPCGVCIGCRTDRATEWALRCTHEAKQWGSNSFLTLTYDDAHIPPQGHLKPKHLQLFLKRLRRRHQYDGARINRDPGGPLRYLACGEYGEEGGRPHYHGALFNCGFNRGRRVGKDLYEYDILYELWPYGKHTVGEFRPEAAAYIAQYTLKKKPERQNYEFDRMTGEITWEGPPQPFLRVSLNPPIGATWLAKYKTDIMKGYITANGRKHGVPRAYKNALTEDEKQQLRELVQQRLKEQPPADGTIQRLNAAEAIHKRRKQLQERRPL